MKGPVIVDTGPIVALLNRRDRHHPWASERFRQIVAPAFTCEAVISECCFLLDNIHSGVDALMQLVARGVIVIDFSFQDEYLSIAKSLKKYRSVPMSFADACLVRMSEKISNTSVLTLDEDFRIYRKNGRAVIPTIMPTR